MSTSRFLILGLVRWLQPVHGYEVQRELMSWGVQDWARIKRGSIYHALKRLTTDGCLEIVSTEQVDNRPARTSYRITPKGEEEFQSRLREALWSSIQDEHAFWVGWSFIPVLSFRETAAILRNRARLLGAAHSELTRRLTQAGNDPTRQNFLPRHVRLSLSRKLEGWAADIKWCEDTAVEAEEGRLYSEVQHEMSAATAQNWKAHIQTLRADGQPTDATDGRIGQTPADA